MVGGAMKLLGQVFIVSSPDPTLSRGDELSRISWACAHFCGCHLATFYDKPAQKWYMSVYFCTCPRDHMAPPTSRNFRCHAHLTSPRGCFLLLILLSSIWRESSKTKGGLLFDLFQNKLWQIKFLRWIWEWKFQNE